MNAAADWLRRVLLEIAVFKKHFLAGLADGGRGTTFGEGLDRWPEKLGVLLQEAESLEFRDPVQAVAGSPCEEAVCHFSAALGTLHRITSVGNILAQR